MANVKNQNKKPSLRHKAVAANICPAKPLAKAPFPLKSLFLASVVAGTRPRPWSGLCQAGSAELLPQQLQRAKYFITLFSSRGASPSQPVGPRGKPARISCRGISWGFKLGFLSKQGLCNPLRVLASGCEACVSLAPPP